MQFKMQSREIPLQAGWDIIVVGGGVAGTGAAIAAAREGSKVLLLEAMGCLGGLGSAGMVPGWCGSHDGVRYIHHTLYETLRKRMAAMLGFDNADSINCSGLQNPEYMKIILDDMAEEAGVETWFFTKLAAVEMLDERTVDALIVDRKEGLAALRAPLYVDTTGDGDLATWAGAEVMKGDENGRMQPVTLCAAFGGVDRKKIWKNDPKGWKQNIENDPDLPMLQGGFINPGQALGKWTALTNAGHLYNIDGTTTADLTTGMIEGRRLAMEMLKGFKKHLPDGYRDAELVTTASLLGVRETRRVVGDYILKAEDHTARRSFDDEIARNHFFLDVHHSKEELEQIRSGRLDWQ
ncbi:MAG: FAD-dependent oxidoreductase, partial [Candidatus Sumerlaeota bacterium]